LTKFSFNNLAALVLAKSLTALRISFFFLVTAGLFRFLSTKSYWRRWRAYGYDFTSCLSKALTRHLAPDCKSCSLSMLSKQATKARRLFLEGKISITKSIILEE
uniref:Secreted protein n=1 Tax=Haemonchus placei TaxID=6290 RepID=A0A158QKJ9_HAEPC